MKTKQINYSTQKPRDLRELIQFSFRIVPGNKSFTPILMRTSEIEDIWSHDHFSMKYSRHNNVWAFIIDNVEYVVPYFVGLGAILEDAGFQMKSFHVPFSNSDYPVAEYDKWAEIQRVVKNWNILDAREKCRIYSKSAGISPLPNRLLEDAFEIPFDGVTAQMANGHKTVEFPNLHSDKINEYVISRLGTFSYKDDVFIVHSYDGRSYSIRSRNNMKRVISTLIKKGYREAQLHVPFANGEIVQVHK